MSRPSDWRTRQKYAFALANKLELDREQRLALASEVLGVAVVTWNNLGPVGIEALIRVLENARLVDQVRAVGVLSQAA